MREDGAVNSKSAVPLEHCKDPSLQRGSRIACCKLAESLHTASASLSLSLLLQLLFTSLLQKLATHTIDGRCCRRPSEAVRLLRPQQMLHSRDRSGSGWMGKLATPAEAMLSPSEDDSDTLPVKASRGRIAGRKPVRPPLAPAGPAPAPFMGAAKPEGSGSGASATSRKPPVPDTPPQEVRPCSLTLLCYRPATLRACKRQAGTKQDVQDLLRAGKRCRLCHRGALATC